MKTADRARGKWRGILLQLGIDERFLSGKHGPCPFCEGKDRYRWDNSKGNGSFFCSQCGSGDGFELLKRSKGWTFHQSAAEVDKIVSGHVAEKPKPAIDPKARVDMLNRLWSASVKLTGADPASQYLASRNVPHNAGCLRFHAHCPKPYGEGHGPAMLALVMGADGEAVNIHRTFLAPPVDGKRQRASMPGDLPDGSAVRLFPVHGARLGIAEGIETAIAASKRFGLPVWAAINSTLLSKWLPPAGVEQVTVFGDCDAAFGGQASAYALAHRLATRFKVKAEVMIPSTIGRDWADSDAA